MFANRGKMTKKDMQNNMRAMLAKTKVADNVVTSQGSAVGGGTTSAPYAPKKNFLPAKNKSNTSANNKSSNQPNKRTSSLRRSGQVEK